MSSQRKDYCNHPKADVEFEFLLFLEEHARVCPDPDCQGYTFNVWGTPISQCVSDPRFTVVPYPKHTPKFGYYLRKKLIPLAREHAKQRLLNRREKP